MAIRYFWLKTKADEESVGREENGENIEKCWNFDAYKLKNERDKESLFCIRPIYIAVAAVL